MNAEERFLRPLRLAMLGALLLTSRSASGVEPASSPLEEPVPFLPTEWRVLSAMLELAEVQTNDVVMDLGCGDGRIVIGAAKLRGARGIGVELNPELIARCQTNAQRAGVSERVEFRQEDLFGADLDGVTVVMLYLGDEANLKLRSRLLAELEPGTRVVSNTFPMGDWLPDRVQMVDMFLYATPLYRWVVPADFSGRWSWELDRQGKRTIYLCDIRQKYQKLEPTLTRDGQEVRVRSAVTSGDRIALLCEEREGDQVTHLRLTGQLRGQRIEGAAEGDFAPSYPEKKWQAGRVEDPQKAVAVTISEPSSD